jgi:hypothetical protein
VGDLHIWDGSDFEASACLGLLGQEAEILECIQEGVVAKPEFLFLVQEKHEESIFLFVKWIEYKHGLSVKYPGSITSNELYEEIFESWEKMVKGEVSQSGVFAVQGTLLRKIAILCSLINEMLELKYSILSTSPILPEKYNDFCHNWWDGSFGAEARWGQLLDQNKHLSKNRVCKKYLDYIADHQQLFVELRNSSLDLKFAICSAYAFAASKIAILKGENDRAILLLHRSIDFILQSYLVEYRLAVCNRNGISYSDPQYSAKPVSVSMSKDILINSRVIQLNEAEIKALDHLNFARNRLLLTHSLCSISQESVNSIQQGVHGLVRSLSQGLTGTSWQSRVRSFLAKPCLELEDIFDIEDSFDAYVKVRKLL